MPMTNSKNEVGGGLSIQRGIQPIHPSRPSVISAAPTLPIATPVH
jgi:hypothetical protein